MAHPQSRGRLHDELDRVSIGDGSIAPVPPEVAVAGAVLVSVLHPLKQFQQSGNPLGMHARFGQRQDASYQAPRGGPLVGWLGRELTLPTPLFQLGGLGEQGGRRNSRSFVCDHARQTRPYQAREKRPGDQPSGISPETASGWHV